MPLNRAMVEASVSANPGANDTGPIPGGMAALVRLRSRSPNASVSPDTPTPLVTWSATAPGGGSG